MMLAENTTKGRVGPRGLIYLAILTVAAMMFFRDGLAELFSAWTRPEYSHGPLIPLISGLLFLRQLKTEAIITDSNPNRLPGVLLLVFALTLAMFGQLISIGDIVAYALILWVGAVLLISFGWSQGRRFWPPVLHLVYMLPLPGALYYGISTWLQGVSSELGVYFLELLGIPVFLEGNIIDLGVLQLHVAEACSGLRYLFPILSFSYIFAVLYRGPMWHKAVLLVSAAPITVLMNSVRIAIAGVVSSAWGPGYVTGITHFFEGWVIFVSCILLLFLLAWVLVLIRRDRVGVIAALDLDTEGLWQQMLRLRLIEPSRALAISAGLTMGLAILWPLLPQPEPVVVLRDPFAAFPSQLGTWEAGPRRALEVEVERVLAADDYHSVALTNSDAKAPVDLFMAWYADQNTGGAHAPEVCLPGAGWEIAALEQIPEPDGAGTIARAIIQKGSERMLVYFWYEQLGRRTGSGFTARVRTLTNKIQYQRADSALVRLITPIGSQENVTEAEARLVSAIRAINVPLSHYLPGMNS